LPGQAEFLLYLEPPGFSYVVVGSPFHKSTGETPQNSLRNGKIASKRLFFSNNRIQNIDFRLLTALVSFQKRHRLRPPFFGLFKNFTSESASGVFSKIAKSLENPVFSRLFRHANFGQNQ
jgi:hypothetical protein